MDIKAGTAARSGCQSKSLGGRAPYIPEDALGTAQMCPRPPRGSAQNCHLHKLTRKLPSLHLTRPLPSQGRIPSYSPADCPSLRSDDKGRSFWHNQGCERGVWQGHMRCKARHGVRGPQTEGRTNAMTGVWSGSPKGHLQVCPTSLTAPFSSNPTLGLFNKRTNEQKKQDLFSI